MVFKNGKVYPMLDEYQRSKIYERSDQNFLHPEVRKPTDVCFFTVFATFLTILSCLIGYCIFHGDIGRVIHGYDNCGTVCGHTMLVGELDQCYKTIDDKNFGSLHLVYYKQGQSKQYDRICTKNCSLYEGYKQFLNRCLPSDRVRSIIEKLFTKTGIKDFFFEVTEDFGSYWKVFIYMCLLSLVISVGFLVLFPFVAGFLVWIVLVGAVCACLGATIYLWISWKQLKDLQKEDQEIKKREVYTFLGLAILATIVTVIVLLIIFVMIKRVKLVIQLFEESGKAILTMPMILLEPALTFLSLIFTMALWIYFCLWISSSGFLTEKRQNIYYYKKDGFMETAKVLNFLGMLWMIQFVIGCQHMIIAGAVSKWYFTREKENLTSPITESFYNLTRYHLGTVAVGSFLIALVQLLRAIVAWMLKNLKKDKNSCVEFMAKMCSFCLWVLEHVLNMISRNAYIMTAMYGFPFYKAGKQAFNHLAMNPLRVAAINSVGDFVLFLSKVLVVACTVAISAYFLKSIEGVQHVWVPLVFLGLFSYFISHCFVTVYEMTIDTIFICFCEDCELNDGVTRPYFMSRGLMEFVEDSKNSFDLKTNTKALRREDSGELQTVSLAVDQEDFPRK